MPDAPPTAPDAASARCPRLLVSVRDAAEARTAVECGVDLVDVKEPRNGALGAATAETIRAVAQEVGSARPISVALGELLDLQADSRLEVLSLAPIQFAKIGLAGAGEIPRWWRHWQHAWSSLPRRLSRVGVVYVDWREAGAPRPPDALAVFADSGCRAVLFDTYCKDGRTLLDHAASGELTEWIHHSRMAAPLLVLAGSLCSGALDGLQVYRPDYVAIRGAACQDGRLGRIAESRLRQFAAALQEVFHPATCAKPIQQTA